MNIGEIETNTSLDLQNKLLKYSETLKATGRKVPLQLTVSTAVHDSLIKSANVLARKRKLDEVLSLSFLGKEIITSEAA